METITHQNTFEFEEDIVGKYPVEFRPDLKQPPVLPEGIELDEYLKIRVSQLDFCPDITYNELVRLEWESINDEVEEQSKNGFVTGVESWRLLIIDFLEAGAAYQYTLSEYPKELEGYLNANGDKHKYAMILFEKCGYVPGFTLGDYEKLRKEIEVRSTMKLWAA
ncbi:hypothetical protein DYH10_02070 [Candidatus Saccharibacteria bacterium CPR2]|nr:hypothetical protein [Candidatus Saccharibacteria bacterium CPR2]